MYEFESRVRYSETDENGVLTVTGLVNYLQDCSTFHSMDVGLSVERLKEFNRAWLLSGWDIHILRMPKLYERIVIGTSPHLVRGVAAMRNFWVRAEEGGYLVKADSEWFCYDIVSAKPVRVEDRMIDPFGPRKNVLELPPMVRRVRVPEELVALKPLKIEQRFLDSNHHVNNAQYIEIAREALEESAGLIRNRLGSSGLEENDGAARPESEFSNFNSELERQTPETIRIPSFQCGRIRAEYRKAALLGDLVVPKAGRTEQGMVVSLQNEDGEVYCNVEIG